MPIVHTRGGCTLGGGEAILPCIYRPGPLRGPIVPTRGGGHGNLGSHSACDPQNPKIGPVDPQWTPFWPILWAKTPNLRSKCVRLGLHMAVAMPMAVAAPAWRWQWQRMAVRYLHMGKSCTHYRLSCENGSEAVYKEGGKVDGVLVHGGSRR